MSARRARRPEARKFSTAQLLEQMALGLTQSAAAQRLGVTQGAVAKRLEAEGLSWPDPRARGSMDAATFARLWQCRRIQIVEIAALLGVTKQAVSLRAKTAGLKSRRLPKGEFEAGADAFIEAHRRRRRFSTEDLVALMSEGITQSEAAQRLGVTQGAVAARLAVDGIAWPAPTGKREIDAATFARMWRCERIGTEEIARFLGVTRQAVSLRAHNMGLPSRKHVRAKRWREAELRELWLAGVSTREIAAHFGLGAPSCVSRAVTLMGLPRRVRGKGGKTHAGWVGTMSMEEYQQVRLGRAMLRAAQQAAE